MNWGDIPGWAGVVVGIGAAVIAWKARHDSAKSAQESARQAMRAADAAERSAAVDEAAFAEQQREAAERRAAEEEAARPRVELTVDHVRGKLLALRNLGEATAEGVVFEPVPPGVITRNWPDGVTLRHREAHEFFMAGSLAAPTPLQVWVRWDGQPEPVALPVPRV